MESSNQKENVEEEERKETLKKALEVRILSVSDQDYFVLEINIVTLLLFSDPFFCLFSPP